MNLKERGITVGDLFIVLIIVLITTISIKSYDKDKDKNKTLNHSLKETISFNKLIIKN